MKRFTEYDPNELLDMTDEQITKLLDLECANRGIGLLPLRPVEPPQVPAEPDVVVYTAGGQKFANKADAQKVVDLLNSLPVLETYSVKGGSYSWQGPYGVRVHEDFRAEVGEEKHWTPEHYDRHRQQMERHKEAKDRFQAEKKEYDTLLAQRDEVLEEINVIRRQADTRQRQEADVLSTFDRYVELAEGDRDQALKFYLHAETDYPEDFIREVLNMQLPTEDAFLDNGIEG